MELLRNVNGKMLHCGYTTGSCAAAATKAALIMLLTKRRVNSVIIDTPAGIKVTAEILDVSINDDYVKCAVRKDSGDDPDATRDMLVYSKVSFFNDDYKGNGISIKGGEGVGIVTKPGLDQPVGEYAINSTPRTMITDVVRELTQKFDYSGGISIELSIPGGEEVAKGTFNPRMGIEGGLSIIGTSGIVEPMSDSALVGTIATL
ncbi:cobalt-precorrin-5B (C(1))-methyltransferase CbiD, partial [Mogibacterium sp.]